ncbi:MAG: ABC-2 transporter permease [Clostridia bacterium]|nr:ABC-2 transporter permease [Clostridia bacterium]
MNNILRKEMKLSASVLSYLFIPFGLMFLIPNYPVLCGAFFVTLGIFQSFQNTRETNDIVFSALLPIAKKDIVKGKYLFVCVIEGAAALIMTAAVIIRMTILEKAEIYINNTLMNANFFAIACAFVIFGLFNAIFVGGFFRTAYKTGVPFVIYTVSVFPAIFVAESIRHIPGLEGVNAFGTDKIILQILLLICGIAVFLILTLTSLKFACKNFEKIDL